MAMLQKILAAVESLPEFDKVNLKTIFVPGQYTPPPTLASQRVAMATFSIHSHSDTEGPSAGVDSGAVGFSAKKLMDLVVHNLLEQNVLLRASTWKKINTFYENANFSDRCGFQIFLESMLVFSKLDADVYFLDTWSRHNPITRNGLFDFQMTRLINSALNKHPSFRISLAVDDFAAKVKEFLKQASIIAAFLHGLTIALVDDSAAPLDKKRMIDDVWVRNQIGHMQIYVVGEFASLRGVTLTDGILTDALVDESKESELRHMADLYTVACHETGHYLVRVLADDFNFSTPNKSLDSSKTTVRTDTALGGTAAMEMGRFVEMTLFGNVQADWRNSDDKAASKFIESAAKQSVCPPPLIKSEDHKALGLQPRKPSYPCAMDFIDPISWID